MPRFVLLLHDCPGDFPRPTHCDLMLEAGAVLQTWALAELPNGWQALADDAGRLTFSASNSVAVERLGDHRLAYLDYEGPVSGDRGRVRRLDAGKYSEQEELHTFMLDGQFIRGEITLRQISSDEALWQLTVTGR
jgi:hypothetical protein